MCQICIVDFPSSYYHGSSVRSLSGGDTPYGENVLALAAMNLCSTTAVAFSDGGCRPNPGHYACAAVLYHDGVGHQESCYLGDNGTVNDAEYEGLLMVLRMARELRITHLQIRLDSKLVVEQVLGKWQVKSPRLAAYNTRAQELAARFESIEIKHVPREENVIADELVTRLLDEETGRARGGRRTLVCV